MRRCFFRIEFLSCRLGRERWHRTYPSGFPDPAPSISFDQPSSSRSPPDSRQSSGGRRAWLTVLTPRPSVPPPEPKKRQGWRPIQIVAPVLLAVFFIVLWDVAQTCGWISDLLVPRPGEVAISTYELFTTGLIWEHLWTTLFETVAGFLTAAVFAISLALAAGWSRTMRYTVHPYAIVLQVLPMISLAPIIISVFGFGTTSKVVVAALISFFPIFVNTLTGVLTPNTQAEELFLSLGRLPSCHVRPRVASRCRSDDLRRAADRADPGSCRCDRR